MAPCASHPLAARGARSSPAAAARRTRRPPRRPPRRRHARTELRAARARTTRARTARLQAGDRGNVGGSTVTAEENGTVSFAAAARPPLQADPRLAGFRRSWSCVGPFIYTNANVQAALADPDGQAVDEARHETPDRAEQRRTQPDELAHVLAPAYLADGVAVATARRRERRTARRSSRAVVDPAPPRAARAAGGASVHRRPRSATTMPAKPFRATFWLDDAGARSARARRLPHRRRASRITIDTSLLRASARRSTSPCRPRGDIAGRHAVRASSLPGERRRRGRPRRAARRTGGRRSRAPPSRAR